MTVTLGEVWWSSNDCYLGNFTLRGCAGLESTDFWTILLCKETDSGNGAMMPTPWCQEWQCIMLIVY